MLELRLMQTKTPIIQTHLVASYNHPGINGGCNSDASTLRGNPSATKGGFYVSNISTLKNI
jgi:hypothetical protein